MPELQRWTKCDEHGFELLCSIHNPEYVFNLLDKNLPKSHDEAMGVIMRDYQGRSNIDVVKSLTDAWFSKME